MNWWEDDLFNQLAVPADDFQGLEQIAVPVDDAVDQLFDQSGYGVLDSILGGSLSHQTRANLSDPEFDPGIYQQQESYRDRRMRDAQRRADFLRENPMEFESLPAYESTIIGAGQGGLDLIRSLAGVADAAFVPGARRLAEAAGDEAAELEELTRGTTPGGATGNVLARGAMSIIPTIAANVLGGFNPAVLTAGAQSFGGVFEDAREGFERQGYGSGSAKALAYIPATAAFLITAGLTKFFGPTGVEALGRGLNVQTAKKAIRPFLEGVTFTGAEKEALEEAIDQGLQGVLANVTYAPEKTWKDIVAETAQAGGLGFVLGGAVELGGAGVRSLRRGQQGPNPAQIEPLPEVAEPLPMLDQFPPAPAFPGESVQPTINEDELNALAVPLMPEAQLPPPSIVAANMGRARGLRRGAVTTGGSNAIETRIEQPSREPEYIETPQGGTPAETINRDSPVPSGPVEQAIAPAEAAAPAPQGPIAPAPGPSLPTGAPVSITTPASAVPERTIAEEQEQRALEEKEQLTPDEMRRKEVLEKKAPRPTAREYGDLIEYIRERIGRIRGKKSAKKGSEGYYGSVYQDLITRNALKPIFTNDGSGLGWYDVLETLRRDGVMPDTATVDDLQEALARDAEARKGLRKAPIEEKKALDKLEAQTVEFSEIALQNQRSNKRAKKQAKPIVVDSLLPGDEIDIDGEKFTVSNMEFDGETDTLLFLELSDGKRFGVQRLPGGQVIYPDKGKVKEAPVEFVPEAEMAPEDRPSVNPLQRQLMKRMNELRAKPQLTSNEARELEAIERANGQDFLRIQGGDPGKLATVPGQEQAAQMAQMRSEQSQPLRAAPIQTQGDLLGGNPPENTDIPLFGQASLGAELTERTVPSYEATAVGIEAITDLVNRTDLPLKAKQVILDMLSRPVMQKLDWRQLQLVLTDYINGRVSGLRMKRLIALDTERASISTFPHEVAHILFDFLPAIDRQVVEQLRRAEIRKRVTAPHIAEKLFKGMTSDEFAESGITPLFYHLINSSEFLAHYVGQKFADDSLSTAQKSTWNRIRSWLQGLYDTISRVFGITPTIERIYRQMLAGTYKVDLDAVNEFEKQFSFIRSGEEALAVETLTTGTDAQQREADEMQAQSVDIADALMRAGANAATPAAQRILDSQKWAQISGIGQKLNNGIKETYQAVRAKLSTKPERDTIARLAAVQARDFSVRLAKAREDGAKALEEKNRRSFQERKTRLANLKQKFDEAKLINEVSSAVLDSVIARTERALRIEAQNDLEIARLEGQLREVENAKRSSSAMSQLINDMVAVLNSSEEGRMLLSDPDFGTRADIVKVYSDIVRSTGGTLRSGPLMRWAAFILQRNADVKDRLWASQLARDSNIRKGMGAYETRFLSDYERDRRGTIRREVNAAKTRTRKEDFAKFAWRTLNKEVLEAEGQLDSRIEAGEIAAAIENDPAWITHLTNVLADVGVKHLNDLGNFLEITTDADGRVQPNFITLPSGKTVNVDTEHMADKWYSLKRPEWEAAAKELNEWLNNPDNFNNPDYEGYRMMRDKLENYHLPYSTLSPNDTIKILPIALMSIRHALNTAGGRVARIAQTVLSEWEALKYRSSRWFTLETQKMHETRRKGMRSYGLKWGDVFGGSWIDANNWYYANVFNPLAYGNSRGQKFKAGDLLPTGQIVTEEAMADLRQQADSFQEGGRTLKDTQRTKDTLGENPFWRTMLQAAEDMVPRTFNFNLNPFARDFSLAYEMYNTAKTEEEKVGPVSEMTRLLNASWFLTGRAYVQDRNIDFVKSNMTIFDGPEGAFAVIGNRMAQDENYASDFDALTTELSNLSGASKEEAAEIVLRDFGRMLNSWYKMANNESEGLIELPIGKEPENVTTKSRNEAVAPYTFYEYGFKGIRRMATYAAALHSVSRQNLIHALKRVRMDLERQRNDMRAKVQAMVQRGVSGAQRKAIQQQAVERKNGTSYDNWKNLDRRIDMIDAQLDYLEMRDPDQEVQKTLQRSVRALSSALISGFATTYRNTTPTYLSAMMKNFGHGFFRRNFSAAYYVWLDSFLARVAPSLVLSGVKATGMGAWDFMKAMIQVATDKDRSAGKFFNTAGRRMVKELGETVYRRIEGIADAMDRGDIVIPDYVREWDNLTLGSMLYQGVLQEEEFGFGKKLAQIPASALEAATFFVRMLNPSLGDVTQNIAARSMMKGSFGPRAGLDMKLRKLFVEMDQGAFPYNDLDPYDPNNVIPAEKLFANSFLFKGQKTAKVAADTRKFFQGAGIDFDRAVWDFRQEWKRNPKEAKFLTEEQGDKLIFHGLNWINRSSAGGRPTYFHTNDVLKTIVAPYLSWPAGTFMNMLEMFSVPAQSKHSRLSQWGMVFGYYLLPILLASALFFQPAEEEGSRLIKRVLHNAEASSRQWWEREGAKSKAVGLAIGGSRALPLVEIAVNAALNDLPNRASLEPSVAMLNKARDFGRWIGGAAQTGDWTYGLADFMGGIVPDLKVVLNRLESESGKREGRNALALMRRHGTPELLRPFGTPSAGVNVNELTPYGQAMENAALNGDMQEFMKLYREALQVAREMKRPDPEQSVKQQFSHRNPWDRAFKAKLTQNQRNAFLERLSEREKTVVLDAEKNFKRAAELIGATANVTKEDSSRINFGSAPSPNNRSSSRTTGRRGASRGGSLRRGAR